MPIVPRQTFQPLNTPERRVSGNTPAAFGGQEAQATQQVGQALETSADSAQVFVDDYNRAQAKRADTAFSEWLREKSYGEDGFYTKGGTASVEGKEAFLSEVSEGRDRFRNELNSADSQALYDRVVDARVETLSNQVDKHVLKQMEEVKVEASKARTVSASREIIDAATNPAIDPEEFALVYAEQSQVIRSEMEELGEMNNQPPEYVEELIKKHQSDLAKDTLQAVIQGRGWEAGKVFFETYKDQMDPSTRAEMKDTLENGSVLDAAFDIVDELIDTVDLGSPEGRKAARDRIREIEDGKLRNEASKQLAFAIRGGQEQREVEANDWGQRFMSVVLDPNGDVPGFVASEPAGYRNFITQKGSNAFQSMINLRDEIKVVNDFAITDGGIVDTLHANDEMRRGMDWNNPELKKRMTEETWNGFVEEAQGQRLRDSGSAGSVQMQKNIKRFASEVLGEGHSMFNEDNASLRVGFENRIMGRLATLAQTRKPTTADIRREVMREFAPIQQAEIPGKGEKPSALGRWGEKYSDKITSFWENRPEFLGELESQDLEEGHYGYIELKNIPRDVQDKIRNTLKDNGFEAKDHNVERAYFEGLRGNKFFMRKFGMNPDFSPSVLGPQSGLSRQDFKNQHARYFGGYSERDVMVGGKGKDDFSVDAVKGSFLTELEGWRNEPYESIEGGLPTIGVGHKITASENRSGFINIGGQKVDWRKGLTDDQVAELHRQDQAKFRAGVVDSVKVDLNDNQMEALTSFAFNVGLSAFKRSTLLKKVNNGDFEAVPTELARWVFVNKKENEGLANRREKEAEKFLA